MCIGTYRAHYNKMHVHYFTFNINLILCVLYGQRLQLYQVHVDYLRTSLLYRTAVPDKLQTK